MANDTLLVLAHGFLQPEHFSNGMRKLMKKVKKKCKVMYFGWRRYKDIPAIAKEIQKGKFKKIVMAGHSYGVWFHSKLAFALETLGLVVHHFLSADGVGREPRFSAINLCRNIEKLYIWYQDIGVIKGSKIVKNKKTELVVKQKIDAGHAKIDEDADFQKYVVELVS